MSIRVQCSFLVLLVGLIAVGILGYASFQSSKQAVIKEAADKVALLGSYRDATLYYSRTQAVPMVKHLVGEERFYPEIMSGCVMARNVADRFNQTQPHYTMKNAAIDPLWPENKADNHELKVISDLKLNRGLGKSKGIMTKNGKEYFYEASPVVTKEKCLRCHGDVRDAPKDQIMTYGGENGYNRKVGDIVSAMFVYVPLSDGLAGAKASAVKLVAMGAGCVLVALLLVALFLGLKVVTPVAILCKRLEDMSLGKNLETSIALQPNREIGELSHFIDRLRLSIARVINKKG